MRNESTAEFRGQVSVLRAKLTDRAEYLKGKLQLALNHLDDFDKTRSRIFLQMAIKKYREALGAIGSRPPEMVEER